MVFRRPMMIIIIIGLMAMMIVFGDRYWPTTNTCYTIDFDIVTYINKVKHYHNNNNNDNACLGQCSSSLVAIRALLRIFLLLLHRFDIFMIIAFRLYFFYQSFNNTTMVHQHLVDFLIEKIFYQDIIQFVCVFVWVVILFFLFLFFPSVFCYQRRRRWRWRSRLILTLFYHIYLYIMDRIIRVWSNHFVQINVQCLHPIKIINNNKTFF